MTSRRRFLVAASWLAAAFGLPQLGLVRLGLARTAARLLDPLRQPKFVAALPNPLDPDFIFRPTESPTGYRIAARQFEASLGLVDPDTRTPLQTTLWGYAAPDQAPSVPGRTFVIRSGQSITVKWGNELVDRSGGPLPHLLPVDPSLHWADPMQQGHRHGPYLGPVPLVTHLHGSDAESGSDGLPDAWSTPGGAHKGRLYQAVYAYDNSQEAALLFYHDHALGITRLNVYAGLVGCYVIRDANEEALLAANSLPGGSYEIPLLIQDARFLADGHLHYPAESDDVAFSPTHLPEFFGDVILVNGKSWPVLDVEPRPYRFRLANASDSRFYRLYLSPWRRFAQIGTDLGLLDAPVSLSELTLSPGERADIVIDFSGLDGRKLILRNRARAPYPRGEAPDGRTSGQVLAFRVSRPLDPAFAKALLPANLRPVSGPLPPMPAPVRTRKLLLFEGRDAYGRMKAMLGIVDPGNPLDGTLAWEDPITENPSVGDTEMWEIHNATPDAHPIHLHLVGFRIVSRQRFTARILPKQMARGSIGGRLSNIRLRGRPRLPAPGEAGCKDTALMLPGEVTRIVATFRRAGEYVWHCHILSHEDHEMMRPYRVGP
jgi:spore coat protein A